MDWLDIGVMIVLGFVCTYWTGFFLHHWVKFLVSHIDGAAPYWGGWTLEQRKRNAWLFARTRFQKEEHIQAFLEWCAMSQYKGQPRWRTDMAVQDIYAHSRNKRRREIAAMKRTLKQARKETNELRAMQDMMERMGQ